MKWWWDSVYIEADYLPFLRWFDFHNLEKRLKSINKRFDTFLDKLIHEQRSKKERENTMIDHLLHLQESQPEYYTDQIIKGLVLVINDFKYCMFSDYHNLKLQV